MPYQQQDIKPLLRKLVDFSDHPLPEFTMTYNSQVVSTRAPYAFIEFALRKIGHSVGYFLLTLLCFLTLRLRKITHKKTLLISGIFAFVIAYLDEFHQTFIPGRTGQFIDVVVADGFGIMLAFIVISVFEPLYARNNKMLK